MATVKCALGKRGRPSHEWNDGKKDRVCVDCEVPPNFYCAYGKRRAENEK